MCLSNLYVDKSDEPVGTNICKICVENGEVIATDLMGREIRLFGEIEDIDLIENTVRVHSVMAV